MAQSEKQKLGQFYTTNYKYILDGLIIPQGVKNIIEPFVGRCDLLNFIQDKTKFDIEMYDISPKKDCIIFRDTLMQPPRYNNKFVLTNPPYLARNKSKDKTPFDKYNVNDLYKCFLSELLQNRPIGGIVIIPLNFWCSIRKTDVELRAAFVSVFDVVRINMFEEKVFDDTTYTICAFQFQLRGGNKNSNIQAVVFPSKKEISFKLSKENNYTIGGEIYKLPQNKNRVVDRVTHKNIEQNTEYTTNILLKTIDDSLSSQICLSLNNQVYVDETENCTARSYATLIIKPKLSHIEQEELVQKFNDFLKQQREKYNSLFLTNYRESNTICRKRISFKLAYEIVNYLLK